MKKLSLKPNTFDKGEVLTRAQLKKVMGGSGSDEESGCAATCNCPSGKVTSDKKTSYTVSVGCSGSCSATDDVGAYCEDETASAECNNGANCS